MRTVIVLSAALLLVASAPPARADVRMTIQDGRVSLVAKDATLRQILAEWARVGRTRFVNLERVPGGPVSLQLSDVTEAQALDTLLRALSGDLAAPRNTLVAGASLFDRVILMPSVAPPPSAGAPSGPSVGGMPGQGRPPMFPQPMGPSQFVPPPQPQPATGEDQDEPPAHVSPPQFMGNPVPGLMVPGVTGQPPGAPQQLSADGVIVVGGSVAPAGAATPGLILQPPQPPTPPKRPDRE